MVALLWLESSGQSFGEMCDELTEAGEESLARILLLQNFGEAERKAESGCGAASPESFEPLNYSRVGRGQGQNGRGASARRDGDRQRAAPLIEGEDSHQFALGDEPCGEPSGCQERLSGGDRQPLESGLCAPAPTRPSPRGSS